MLSPGVILCFGFTRQGKDQVLSQLGSNEAVLFRGIADAFPNTVIPSRGKGIYQKTTKPYPSCALIGVQSGYTRDDRIVVTTLLGEEVDLNNRSRAYKPSGIETVPLPVHHRSSINGNVMLVAFGSKTSHGNYQAVCEDILIWSNSGQTEQVQFGKHVNMSSYVIGRRGLVVGSEQQMRGLRNDVINMSRAWDK